MTDEKLAFNASDPHIFLQYESETVRDLEGSERKGIFS